MVEIIIAVVALAIGGGIGYAIFRYVLKGQYQEVMDKARKDAEVVKEKKLLEVKEKFLNCYCMPSFSYVLLRLKPRLAVPSSAPLLPWQLPYQQTSPQTQSLKWKRREPQPPLPLL